ncbi:hypothetical protein [Ideonella sp.]|uniref:hypothetical protein n=1 Tax=Ideonella sp. TaxID=1929293 RepID=UPI0035B30AF3
MHGLNPLTGWLFVAGRGAPAGHRVSTWRALVPIAAGHLASMGVVAVAVVFGRSLDRTWLQAAAAGLLAVVAGLHWRARRSKRVCVPAGHAGLALWSFIVATGHGAGLMLVPALIPLCAPGPLARAASATGSLTMAFAAVGVHTVAMLAASGAAANVAHRLWGLGACRLVGLRPRPLSAPPALR